MDDVELGMKVAFKQNQAMTLIEVIVVIAIVAILARLSLPTRNIGPSKWAKAKIEINNLVAAIEQHDTTYSRLPAAPSPTNHPSDFTYGTWGTSAAAMGITNALGPQANNSAIMAILLDMTNFPNGKPTLNVDHKDNPQRTSFLNIKISGDTNSSGVGMDGIYRDPWGHPYIITFDYNCDNKCRDAFYRLASVSETSHEAQQGVDGLIRPTEPPYNSTETRDSFENSGQIMVWSLGQDGKADPNQKAHEGVNKDNLTSW